MNNEYISEPEGSPEDEKKEFDIVSELYDWSQALIVALISIMLIFTLFARLISVEGRSMIPTLHGGDKILLSNLLYEPKCGDVIVVTMKDFQHKPLQPIVKRVVATSGQTVDINFSMGSVTVDGVVLDEPYINERTSRRADVDFPVTVPEGCIFVMGDNRNESLDSRSTQVGMVDKRAVLGHVLFRAYPFDDMKVIK